MNMTAKHSLSVNIIGIGIKAAFTLVEPSFMIYSSKISIEIFNKTKFLYYIIILL